MQVPVQISFRNTEQSDAVEERIREKAVQLEEYSDEIVSCKVMVELPHKRHNQGNLYHIRIDVSVPGKEIVVSRDPKDNHAHEDVYVAIRDAFQAAAQQLRAYTKKRQGNSKRKPAP